MKVGDKVCKKHGGQWNYGTVTDIRKAPKIFVCMGYTTHRSSNTNIDYGFTADESELYTVTRRSWHTTPADIACQGKY